MTSTGYNISPKSNVSCFMSAGDGIISAEGRNVELRTNQSDNKDEWILIPENDLSLIALPESYDRTSFFDSVISELSSIGYSNCYDNEETIDKGVTSGELVGRMANSKITVIRTHGSKTAIETSDGTLTRANINSMPSTVFSSSELIIYGACLTGSGRAGAANLVNATHSHGCQIVIGFEEEVWNTEVNEWCDAFFQALVDGKTVLEACSAADKHIIDNWYDPERPYEVRTDSWYIAGDSSATFT